jgi:hypothetical protein
VPYPWWIVAGFTLQRYEVSRLVGWLVVRTVPYSWWIVAGFTLQRFELCPRAIRGICGG